MPIQSASGAGILADGYEGRARLVVDADRGVVLGATFVGQDVAELLHAATIAVVGEVPVDRLWHAVPAFPTMSEVWLRLLEDLGRPEARRVSGPTVRIRLTDSPISRPGYWTATAVGFTWGFLWSTGPDRASARASWCSRACRSGRSAAAGRASAAATSPIATRATWCSTTRSCTSGSGARTACSFPLLYLFAGRDPLRNRFEIEAGLETGGYLPQRGAPASDRRTAARPRPTTGDDR